MASPVDISNLALARLGDDAAVSSISPPDQSFQAQLCARFYPIARDTALEYHQWSFTTTRVALTALASNPSSTWAYCYAMPGDLLNSIAVLDSAAPDDYVVNSSPAAYPMGISDGMPVGGYTPQPYATEQDILGNSVILTNQANAELRYTFRQTDTTKYSAMFTDAVAWLMSSYLAGPLLKGTSGAQMTKFCLESYKMAIIDAVNNDTAERREKPVQNVPWITNR